MADDIDDLLDEVESKFVKRKSVEKKTTTVNSSRRRREVEEMDDLINDICGDPDPLEKTTVTARKTSSKTKQSRPMASKCFPVCIGGSSMPKGHGNSVNKRACDTLRCTSCDFKIVSFDNFEWHETTDYLFLRNNVPEFDKLKSKLLRRDGHRAYCCQCSHICLGNVADVNTLPMKWVCGEH